MLATFKAVMTNTRIRLPVLLLVCVGIAGCASEDAPDTDATGVSESESENITPPGPAGTENADVEVGDTDASSSPAAGMSKGMGGMAGMSNMPMPKPEDIVFKDNVESNVEAPVSLDGLVFFNTKGDRVLLSDYAGSKNVVLVFTEGFAGMLCPFCKTQTARLVANYEEFQKLDTEVLVVYPGESDHLQEFIDAAKTTDKGQVDKVPFPIVLDPTMNAVEFFNIKSKLAHPSTYIIDKQGRIQFAYVGSDMSADRPSVKSLLRTLNFVREREKKDE